MPRSRLVTVVGLTCLLGGCASDPVGGRPVPTSQPTDAANQASDGCPTVRATPGHAVSVDYVDFVQGNGEQYLVADMLGVPPPPVTDADVGTMQFQVRCSLSELN